MSMYLWCTASAVPALLVLVIPMGHFNVAHPLSVPSGSPLCKPRADLLTCPHQPEPPHAVQ